MSTFELVSSSIQVKRQDCDTWPPERVRELIRLANLDPPLKRPEIAQRLGISENSLKHQIYRRGIKLRTPEGTWTPERVQKLEQLFKEGLPTAEIGRRLGLTKNAVIGRLDRMGGRERRNFNKWLSSIGGVEVPREPYKPPHDVFNGGGCLWPYGHPGTPGFRFCGHHELEPGKPYCAKHCAVAYVKHDRSDADIYFETRFYSKLVPHMGRAVRDERP